MSKLYYKIISKTSKNCGLVGECVERKWGEIHLRMIEGDNKGRVLKFNENLSTKRLGDEVQMKTYIASREEGKKDTSKVYGVIINDRVSLTANGVTHAEAVASAKDVKLRNPCNHVSVFKIIGVAQSPKTTVEVK